jgi:hypothetical protein
MQATTRRFSKVTARTNSLAQTRPEFLGPQADRFRQNLGGNFLVFKNQD